MTLARIAHADGAAAAVAVETAGAEGEGGAAAAVSELEDGDKPEYIQRADEQVLAQAGHVRMHALLVPPFRGRR